VSIPKPVAYRWRHASKSALDVAFNGNERIPYRHCGCRERKRAVVTVSKRISVDETMTDVRSRRDRCKKRCDVEKRRCGKERKLREAWT
jgi:hypothetical protein